ncbi:hypothetical protein PINS_up020668 [Pythium insidiosum]|nr:hypothetical protein PINS_up020668 [Pythium insidiosum]
MAAAMHGRADVIEAVLRSSAASVLQEDWHGATPAEFARQAGHSNIEAALRACENAEREKEFVYDVYCVDITAMSHSNGVAGASPSASDDAMLTSAPVVSVSSAVQSWLAQDGAAAWAGRDGDEDVDELLLDSDADSNVDDDKESIDSNDESYFLNDYPDEESDDDVSDLDSDDDDLTRGPRRMQAARHHRFAHDDTTGDAEAYDY